MGVGTVKPPPSAFPVRDSTRADTTKVHKSRALWTTHCSTILPGIHRVNQIFTIKSFIDLDCLCREARGWQRNYTAPSFPLYHPHWCSASPARALRAAVAPQLTKESVRCSMVTQHGEVEKKMMLNVCSGEVSVCVWLWVRPPTRLRL